MELAIQISNVPNAGIKQYYSIDSIVEDLESNFVVSDNFYSHADDNADLRRSLEEFISWWLTEHSNADATWHGLHFSIYNPLAGGSKSILEE